MKVSDLKTGVLLVVSLLIILSTISVLQSNKAKLEPDFQGLGSKLPVETLYENARHEKTVTIYSVTSRIYHIEKAFEKRYPDLDLIPFVLSSREQITRFKAERRANLAGVDVMYFNDAPGALELTGEPEGIFSFVPERLKNKIPAHFQTPLLYHRLSTKVLLYNEQTYSKPPVSNLWELTLPKWRGRVVMVDPASRQDYLDLLASFIAHSDEMAAAYIQLFAKPPTLIGEVKSVGEKFVRDLFNNGLVLVASTERLNSAIGDPQQDRPPIGFGTYSDIRVNQQRGWAIQAAKNIEPASGIIYPVVLAINKSSQHMSAAKLLVDFIMGDDSSDGGPALAPFLQAGEYLTRTDISHTNLALTHDDLNAWTVAPKEIIQLRGQAFDLVLELSAK